MTTMYQCVIVVVTVKNGMGFQENIITKKIPREITVHMPTMVACASAIKERERDEPTTSPIPIHP